LERSYDYRRLTLGLAAAAVLLGVLAGFLAVTASGAFAQTVAPEGTAVGAPSQVYALTKDNELLFFDGDDPRNAQRATITCTTSCENLIGIDFRPSDRNLYGVGDQGTIYLIEENTFNTGEVFATEASQLTEALNGTHFGIDFNPRTDEDDDGDVDKDELRIVSDTGRNLTHNLITGETDRQTRLDYATGDPNEGEDPKVTAVAYTNNSTTGVTDTTLYDIDTGLDILAIQTNPPTGQLNTVDNLGVNAKSITGFDIVTTLGTTVDNRAFAAIQPKGKSSSNFYEVDLTTGQVTRIGRIDGSGTDVEGLAIPIGQT
jgi:hypothetical protein